MARPDAATLWQLYVEEAMTIAVLARRLNVAPQTVHNWLVAAGVPRRPSPARRRVDIDDDDIRRLYVEQGLSAAEIGARLGCGPITVYSRLARLGVPRRSPTPRHRARPDDSELRCGYVERGLSLRQLAARYGVTPQAVRRWLMDAGIPCRPAGSGRPDVAPEELVALYAAGWSGPQIADLWGCSASFVYQCLDAAGMPRRPVTPSIGRDELLAALTRGLSAPDIAEELGVSVSCVCRALRREGLATASQAERQQRARRMAERHAGPSRSGDIGRASA